MTKLLCRLFGTHHYALGLVRGEPGLRCGRCREVL